MGGATVPILVVLGIVGLIVWWEVNKSPLESLDSSGCGCFLVVILLIAAGLMYIGAKYGE